MDWYSTVIEVIDMRSFSNLWYWIALAVLWSTNSHWVLGVPYDMIQRAARYGGEAQMDLEAVVRAYSNRLIYISEVSGLWLTGTVAGLLTMLALLAVVYAVEFAQAVLLLGLPMTLVGLLSMRAAREIRARGTAGEALRKRLLRHRIHTQLIGMVSIFVTALFGMYQNMNLGVFG